MTQCKSFTPDQDIPDLQGKVILVTGGNSGLGLESIRQLAKHNPAHIYLAARSKSKAEEAIRDIHASSPAAANTPITSMELDLSSFESIKAAVRTFQASSSRLDILMNNAGIFCTPEGLTKEGYELQFGTNHMGPALFTQLLLPTLKSTAAAGGAGADVRVVFLSSDLESYAPRGTYNLAALKTNMADVATRNRYSVSKLANVHYAAALAERNPDLRVVSVHPGVVRTNLQGPLIDGSSSVMAGVYSVFFRLATSVDKGALNQLWAAVSPEASSGTYYHPVGVAGKGSKLSRDATQREKLWDWTQKELQGHLSS